MVVYKIGIVGSAGTGKSGVGRLLASKLSIPFLASKDITRDILKRRCYDWSSGVYVEKFLAREECQDELLEKTISRESNDESFVTDRTCIDLAAYAVAELNNKTEKVDEIVRACRSHASSYTHLILCPWGIVPLENNGVRTVDPWYQFMIHSIMLGFLREWNLKYHIVMGTGEKRVLDIISHLESIEINNI